MKKLKESTKIILGMVIGLILSTASYVLADSIIDSKNVFYKDNSGLAVNNVQDAIDGTCTKFSKQIDAFLDKVYPIGSVYISTTLDTPAKVKTAIGGTWEAYGKGQTLVGVDTAQNEFKTVNTTGGAKSVSYTPKGTIGSTGLTINQIPSHSHSYDKPNANTGSHTLTIEEMPRHTHIQNPHSHIMPYQSNVNQYNGFGFESGLSLIVNGNGIDLTYTTATNQYTGGNGGHTHPISTTSTSTGAAGKGTTSDGHTHSFTGTADSINNLQPYITVYMYKRTA